MNKLIKNGKVAVLYSPGHGAGWSTWSHGNEEAMIFDPDIAEAVLAQDYKKAQTLAMAKWPDAYLGGLNDLQVEWLDTGTRFEIHEYDGSESVRILTPTEGYIA